MENYLTTTFITRPENDGTPITLTIPRLEYRDWIKDQEAIYNCRFYNKTKSDGGHRLKNNEYLEHGYIHPPPGQKRGRGNESFIFNEVIFLIICFIYIIRYFSFIFL